KVTIHRELDALHLLGLVIYDEEPYVKHDGSSGMRWVYQLAPDVDVDVLNGVVPEMSVDAPNPPKEPQASTPPSGVGSDVSGTKTAPPPHEWTDGVFGYPRPTDSGTGGRRQN